MNEQPHARSIDLVDRLVDLDTRIARAREHQVRYRAEGSVTKEAHWRHIVDDLLDRRLEVRGR